MKYKVGDKVRVREDLKVGGMYGECYVSPQMEKYLGCAAEVVMIDETEEEETYRLLFDNEECVKDWPWAWVDVMLDPYSEPDVIFLERGEPNVNHPQHYKHGEIETIDVIKMALTAEEFRGFLKGNVLKYELRAPYKHETPDEDYQKAKDYYDLLEGLE